MKLVTGLVSLVSTLLDLWTDYRIRQRIRREEALERRLENLKAREAANEIDDKPAPDNKHDILDGM